MLINIKHNFPDVARWVRSAGNQVRFATAVALTRTAQQVKAAELKEIERVFDRPTPYTKRSLFMSPATKAKLEAQVWLKDDRAGSGTPATRYLLPHIEGGPRGQKGFERMLVRAGHMGANERAVPAAGARLDAYGNMSRGQIVQILSQLRAFYTVGGTDMNRTNSKRSRAKRANSRYFVSRGKGVASRGFGSWWNQGEGRVQHLPRGVWMATSKGVVPVLIFVERAGYTSRFKFFEVARRVVASAFPRHFDVELTKALRSAR